MVSHLFSSERTAGGSLIHSLNYECNLYNRMCILNTEYWFQKLWTFIQKTRTWDISAFAWLKRSPYPLPLSSVWINSPFEFENDSQIHSTTTLPGAFARFLIAAEIYVVGSASGLLLTRWLASVPVIICFSNS